MLSDVSTAMLFMEMHRRLAQYSVGQRTDQLFADIEQSSPQAFSQLDVAMHTAFIAHAQTVLQRVADDENT